MNHEMPDHREQPVKRYEMDEALVPITSRLDDIDGKRGRLADLEQYNTAREATERKRNNWLLGIAAALIVALAVAILPVLATFLAQILNHGVQVK